MFDIVKKSNYILCIDIPENPNPIANSMSGAIPLSFSYGCQLLIPDIWQKYYNFKSSISYLDNHVQNNGQSKLTLNKNINLDKIYNELYELIHYRNNIFDSIFLDNNYNNSYYHLICKILNIRVPKIFMNYDNLINLDFRENHIIKYGHNKDYIFYHDNINNLIYMIKTNMMIYFNDMDYDYLISNIILLGKRSYNDIIILNNNLLNNINHIISVYNKHCCYYIFDDKIILLSQN
jgi:hypothetical protein